jgi:hypothetical protein
MGDLFKDDIPQSEISEFETAYLQEQEKLIREIRETFMHIPDTEEGYNFLFTEHNITSFIPVELKRLRDDQEDLCAALCFTRVPYEDVDARNLELFGASAGVEICELKESKSFSEIADYTQKWIKAGDSRAFRVRIVDDGVQRWILSPILIPLPQERLDSLDDSRVLIEDSSFIPSYLFGSSFGELPVKREVQFDSWYEDTYRRIKSEQIHNPEFFLMDIGKLGVGGSKGGAVYGIFYRKVYISEEEFRRLEGNHERYGWLNSPDDKREYYTQFGGGMRNAAFEITMCEQIRDYDTNKIDGYILKVPVVVLIGDDQEYKDYTLHTYDKPDVPAYMKKLFGCR